MQDTWKSAREIIKKLKNGELKHIQLLSLDNNLLKRVYLTIDKKNAWEKY